MSTPIFPSLVRTVGLPWLAAAFLSRLPFAMLPLAVLMYGRELTDSYAVGGAMLAGFSLGGALLGPVVGHLADRLGHRAMVLSMTAVASLTLAGLLVLSRIEATPTMLVVAAGLVGASSAQVGALARATWSYRLASSPDRARRVEAAMGYETVVDEVSFVVGPIIGATLATVVSPTVAIVAAWLVLVSAQLSFAALIRTTTVAVASSRTRPAATIAVWLLLSLTVGGVFGTTQTGVTGALDGDMATFTGLVYAMVGIGSAVSGMLTPLLHRWSLPARVIVAGGVLAAMAWGMVAADSVWMLGLACLGLGVCVAPLLVSAFTGAERLASAGNTLVLALMGTANVAGVGLGAAAAGVAIEARGADAALAIPIVLGLIATGLGVMARLTRADHAATRH